MPEMRPQTERKIKQVFTHLMQTKGLNDLTVSDIARGANINRGTFYLHFVDKFALLAYFEDQTIDRLTAILTAPCGEAENASPIDFISRDTVYQALVYVQGDREFVQALTSDTGDPKFVARFKGILAGLLDAQAAKSPEFTFNKVGFPADYASEILLSTVVSIILLWLHKGATEDPAMIADMIDRCKTLAPVELFR